MALNNAINGPLPLAVANGGTGVETFTENGILYGNGTGDLQVTAELADGQLLIGQTGDVPVPATLTAGSGISISNAAGAVTISSASDAWETVTTDQNMDVNVNYIVNSESLVTLTLPTTIPEGASFRVTGKNSGGWAIAQNAGQQIHFGEVSSLSGVSGAIESTHDRDSVYVVCVTDDVEFNVVDAVGNINVVDE